MSVSKTSVAPDAVRVPVEVAANDDTAVQKAIDHVTQLVDGIAKAAGVKLEAPQTEAPAPVVAPVAKSAREIFVDTIKATGLAPEALERSIAAFDAGEANVSEADVEKAKAMTAQRIQKLQDAVAVLQTLMMEFIPAGSSPSTSAPTVRSHGNPNTTRAALSSGDASVTKGVEMQLADLQKSVATLLETSKVHANPAATEQLAAISKRLEVIEKTRNPAAPVEDTAPTATVKKNFWGGLL